MDVEFYQKMSVIMDYIQLYYSNFRGGIYGRCKCHFA